MIGRLVSAVVVTGLVGAGVVVAVHPPAALTDLRPQPSTTQVVTLPLAARVPSSVCPGPETLLVPEGATPVQPGGPVVVGAVVTGAGAQLAGATLAPGRSPGVTTGSTSRTAAGAVRLDPTVPAARSAGGAAPDPVQASAVQLTLGRTGDLRGLAATTCGTATAKAWLVGGGTVTGERARLVVSNPTASAAVVDVTVHGPDGVVPAPAAQGVTVPAGGSVPLLVDALAPGLATMALTVTARTGRIVASLHDTLVRGMTPGGVDGVSAAAPPATRQLLPGVVVAAPGTSIVRVLAPGGSDAVVRVHLLDASGDVVVPGGVVTVKAGAVRDVPLTGVDDGTYSAVVESDVPVVAAARSWVTGPGGDIAGTPAALGKTVPPSELAWTAATPALSGTVALAVPPLGGAGGLAAPSASLVLATPTSAVVTLREVDAFGAVGAPRKVTSDGSTVTPLAAGTSAILLTTDGDAKAADVHASLLFRTSDSAGPLLSVVPVPAAAARVGGSPTVVQDRTIG